MNGCWIGVIRLLITILNTKSSNSIRKILIFTMKINKKRKVSSVRLYLQPINPTVKMANFSWTLQISTNFTQIYSQVLLLNLSTQNTKEEPSAKDGTKRCHQGYANSKELLKKIRSNLSKIMHSTFFRLSKTILIFWCMLSKKMAGCTEDKNTRTNNCAILL